MIHLLDLLIYAALISLGAVLMHRVHDSQENAVKVERDRTERWRHAYEQLRYDTKTEPAQDVPAPLQLNEQDAWTVRKNGTIMSGRRA